jgi:hypothetical protein
MKVLFHPQTGLPLAYSGRHPNCDVVLYPIHRRRCQYARRYVLPLDPRTASQQQMRDIMRRVVPAWSTLLTPAQRRAWDALAPTVFSRWRAGQGPLSGQQLFVKLNCVWLRVGGKSLLLCPPRRAKFYRSPVVGLEVSWHEGRVRVLLRVAGPMRRDLMIFGAAPCSAGWSKLRHPVYLGLIPAVADRVKDQPERYFDITDWYVGRFGEPEPGKQVFIRTRQQRNCWQSAPKDLSAIVPAARGEPPPSVPFPAPSRETLPSVCHLPFAIGYWRLLRSRLCRAGPLRCNGLTCWHAAKKTPNAVSSCNPCNSCNPFNCFDCGFAALRLGVDLWASPCRLPACAPTRFGCSNRLEAPVLPWWSGVLEPCTRGRSHSDTIASRLAHSALGPLLHACERFGQRAPRMRARGRGSGISFSSGGLPVSSRVTH